MLSTERDKKAAERFFRKALRRGNTRDPREVVTDRLTSYPGALRRATSRDRRGVGTDRLTSYPGALREMKREGELWRFTRHRRGRWLNNMEAMAMLAKGQLRAVPGHDMPAQRTFVHRIFGVGA